MSFRLQCIFVLLAATLLLISASAQADSDAISVEDPQILACKDFSRKAKDAYEAASTCPNLLTQLFPYCGNGSVIRHTRLVDYFTTRDGEKEPVCQDEVILAAELCKSGKSVTEIQKEIDDKFAKARGFRTDSREYLEYKAALAEYKWRQEHAGEMQELAHEYQRRHRSRPYRPYQYQLPSEKKYMHLTPAMLLPSEVHKKYYPYEYDGKHPPPPILRFRAE